MTLSAHIAPIALIRAEDLAEAWGYAGVNSAFRKFWAEIGVKPIRPGWYDPRHIRHRMDSVQGLCQAPAISTTAQHLPLVEQRRARLGTL